ncbi:hypothetical protein OOJ91_13865 [Micromonospora lupini]|uniref:hypothetical protein n=1 Tax=Micromonospora lupini TaxID=285679 RepID=UPI002255E278|nr:hypothetical protein [Micromonospora lupini]MCX5066934.1 hypothetical protein [Micromonospora lupini]
MIGRKQEQPAVDPAAVRLAQLTARHDQALARIEEGLRTAGRDRRTADVLLDLRNLLRPPERPS